MVSTSGRTLIKDIPCIDQNGKEYDQHDEGEIIEELAYNSAGYMDRFLCENCKMPMEKVYFVEGDYQECLGMRVIDEKNNVYSQEWS